nr:MAG TPA: hypothetical protein [Bacteriophage sp.]
MIIQYRCYRNVEIIKLMEEKYNTERRIVKCQYFLY